MLEKGNTKNERNNNKHVEIVLLKKMIYTHTHIYTYTQKHLAI